MTEDREIFIQAVLAADSLPSAVREKASAAQSCERVTFDKSYLDFLHGQIGLVARGPAWTEVLTLRLAALSPYCDRPTLRGTISTGSTIHIIRVDPETRQVIHHESHESAPNEDF